MTTAPKNTRLVQPYLFFDGLCEEALEFYSKTLGAQVEMLMRFKDSPEPPQPGACGAAPGEKVMHATFRIGETTLMASDGRCQGKTSFQGFALALTLSTPDEVDKTFASLADGGQVQVPLAKTFFSKRFGMVTDRFGICWTLVAAP